MSPAGAYHLVEFHHESLAEAHNLGIALASRSKVAAALAAAHRQGGQGVLERLLEAQELQDGEVDGWMETQTALVRADGAIKLNTVTNVDLHFALVVDPGHTESDDSFWLYDALNNLGLLELRMLVVHIFNRFQYFTYCL